VDSPGTGLYLSHGKLVELRMQSLPHAAGVGVVAEAGALNATRYHMIMKPVLKSCRFTLSPLFC